jgi:hypothetical protein
MAQIIKTGNIVTPAKPLVTQRKSATVKIGNGDAPDYGLARPQSMTTGTAVTGFQKKVTRNSLATELAKTAPTEPAARILCHAEGDNRDRAARIFRDANGFAVRTLDMDDAPLHETVQAALDRADEAIAAAAAEQAATDAAKTAKKAEREASKAAKAERDGEILSYLRGKGYSGSLTADIRVLALDAMEADRQVKEYATR